MPEYKLGTNRIIMDLKDNFKETIEAQAKRVKLEFIFLKASSYPKYDSFRERINELQKQKLENVKDPVVDDLILETLEDFYKRAKIDARLQNDILNGAEIEREVKRAAFTDLEKVTDKLYAMKNKEEVPKIAKRRVQDAINKNALRSKVYKQLYYKYEKSNIKTLNNYMKLFEREMARTSQDVEKGMRTWNRLRRSKETSQSQTSRSLKARVLKAKRRYLGR